jgi:hypothetical protein
MGIPRGRLRIVLLALSVFGVITVDGTLKLFLLPARE